MHKFIHSHSPLTSLREMSLGKAGQRSREIVQGRGVGERTQRHSVTRCSKIKPCPWTTGCRSWAPTRVSGGVRDSVCIFHEDNLGTDILQDPSWSSQSTPETLKFPETHTQLGEQSCDGEPPGWETSLGNRAA